ncbi:NUDIX hydrolase [Halioxenophilus sp. WMMB6]|uniref:NUDIX hydrolase n=1 Tax=Halioxenophilus sp. WMMB6 TaxID=3073815 RepID=UPI00295E3FEC|nr:NUDIX hydrolase [Halioxenophilus sp. WMMB6]
MTERFTPHVTVAAVIARDNRFLMVEELIEGQVMYNQPAGHLEADESLTEAVEREILEETGWLATTEHYLGVCLYQAPAGTTFVRHTFVALAKEHVPGATLDIGILRALWLTRDEIAGLAKQLRSPMILSTIDQYLAGQLYPLAMVAHQR